MLLTSASWHAAQHLPCALCMARKKTKKTKNPPKAILRSLKPTTKTFHLVMDSTDAPLHSCFPPLFHFLSHLHRETDYALIGGGKNKPGSGFNALLMWDIGSTLWWLCRFFIYFYFSLSNPKKKSCFCHHYTFPNVPNNQMHDRGKKKQHTFIIIILQIKRKNTGPNYRYKANGFITFMHFMLIFTNCLFPPLLL